MIPESTAAKGMGRAETAHPRRVALPKSSARLQRPYVYVRIVKGIHAAAWGAVAFEGKLYAPGGNIDLDELLPRPAVAIECAGPLGIWKRGQPREILYIAWTFNFESLQWSELARAQAFDSSWIVVLREAVRQALYPSNPDLWNIIRRSKVITDELLLMIDNRLETESAAVRKAVLDAIYEQVAGRIVRMAPADSAVNF